MGNCMSSTKTEKLSAGTTTTTKRTTQTVQRSNNDDPTKLKSTKSKSGKQNGNTPGKLNKNSQGHKLSDNSTSGSEVQVLSPREAAAKAAEERMKKQSKSQGQLGNKLEQERKKSNRKHLVDESEKMTQMKKVNDLVYD